VESTLVRLGGINLGEAWWAVRLGGLGVVRLGGINLGEAWWVESTLVRLGGVRLGGCGEAWVAGEDGGVVRLGGDTAST
jgi:hypothetical protein